MKLKIQFIIYTVATFQVLNTHIIPVATTMNNADIECSRKKSPAQEYNTVSCLSQVLNKKSLAKLITINCNFKNLSQKNTHIVLCQGTVIITKGMSVVLRPLVIIKSERKKQQEGVRRGKNSETWQPHEARCQRGCYHPANVTHRSNKMQTGNYHFWLYFSDNVTK